MNWSLFFKYFIAAAWEIKLRLAILAILTILVAIAYIKLEKPKYKTSWVMLLPGTERSTSLSLDNLGEARSAGSNAYGSVSISPKNTYKEIALSDAVIGAAAKEYGVETGAFTKPRIKLVDQTPAMVFGFKGASGEDLKFRAKLYNEIFHKVLDQLRKNEIERNYRGVESSLSEAKKRLRDAREAIVAYQNQSSLVSESQFQTWLVELETIRSALGQAEVRLASLKGRVNSELSQLGITLEQAKAFLLVQASPANQEAMELLSTKLAEESSQQKIYGTENPIRKELIKEIAGIRKNLATNLIPIPKLSSIPRARLYGLLSKDIGVTLKALNQRIIELDGTQAEIDVLAHQQEATSNRIKKHAKEAAKLNDLQRDHQIAEAIFSSALAKLDTSRLDIYATYPLTQLLTEPGGTITRDRLTAKLIIIALFLVLFLISLSLILTRLRSNLLAQNKGEDLMAAVAELEQQD
ncbi:MAG: hypothetical protein MK188_05350 [Gammaproteobacteria bacterium]|nr:hypothetical protein [Gammaproteobacteria bacterium]